MSLFGFGDLAHSYRSIAQNRQLRQEIALAGQEISSGKKASLLSVTGNRLATYASIETTLMRLLSYNQSASEAAQFMRAAEINLEQIHDSSTDLGADLLIASSAGSEPGLSTVAEIAKGKFASAVSNLNSNSGERSIFAGRSTDSRALAESEVILADLALTISGETSALGVQAAFDAWFDDAGGGFETVAYLGAVSELGAISVSPNESVEFSLRANDQEFRSVLKGFAMAAIVADDAFSGSQEEQAKLLALAGDQLLSAGAKLTHLRATIGGNEALIERVQTRNETEKTALELSRSTIADADPFEATSKLQSAEARLEIFYSITARLSRLSLVDYIR